MTGHEHDPKWSLERRPSSGFLVWRKESPRSKIRFRVDVDVLEFDKLSNEDLDRNTETMQISNSRFPTIIALCVTCLVVVVVSVFLPWYLLGKVGT